MPSRFRTSAFLSLPLAAVMMNIGLAQGIITVTISGTVQDPSGAIVEGATVSATNIGLGTSYTSKVSHTGVFTLPSVPLGEYKLVISQSGFADLTV